LRQTTASQIYRKKQRREIVTLTRGCQFRYCDGVW
jgi:hypothetical protein